LLPPTGIRYHAGVKNDSAKRNRLRRAPTDAAADLDGLRFRFLIAGSVKCGPGWRLGMVRWEQHRLIVVRGGSGQLFADGKMLPLRRGHIVFGLPGELYDIQQHPHKRLVYSIARFEAVNAAGRPVSVPAAFRPALHFEVRSFSLLEDLMLRLTNSIAGTPCWATGFSAALFRFILWLIHEDRHTGDNLQTRNIVMESLRPAVRYRLKPNEREPGTPELARLCGMSTSTFVRRMRACYGLSPKQFLIHRRIEHAKELLLESPYTVEAIAAELGYKEPGHFTSQFKQWVGVSPSAFRTSDR
jgi:AraC-like DNA-binding protein